MPRSLLPHPGVDRRPLLAVFRGEIRGGEGLPCDDRGCSVPRDSGAEAINHFIIQLIVVELGPENT